MSLGMRRLAADIAWIQTLQYYGTHEAEQTEEEETSGGGTYGRFLDYCRRVTRIDPFFTYVYYYGGGVLGWNLNRLDEAEAFIREGIERNPKEWRLQKYLAAMAYERNHDVAALTQFLEAFVTEPDCPNLLRSLLANIYKREGRRADAVRIWTLVLETRDPQFDYRAREQLKLLLGPTGPS
jgi:tetratricopeptide (TPR) repeat protein